MYDGYHFCEDAEGVYNPFSLFNALQDKKFNDYWFESGTPSFLISPIKNTSYDISSLQGEEVDSSLLVSVNTAFQDPIPLPYQSKYLTITEYDKRSRPLLSGLPEQRGQERLTVIRPAIQHILNRLRKNPYCKDSPHTAQRTAGRHDEVAGCILRPQELPDTGRRGERLPICHIHYLRIAQRGCADRTSDQ